MTAKNDLTITQDLFTELINMAFDSGYEACEKIEVWTASNNKPKLKPNPCNDSCIDCEETGCVNYTTI